MALPHSPLAVAMLLFWVVPAAGAVTPERLTWEELPQLVGRHVSIALYDGGAVTGTVHEVHADALLIQVSKSTNPVAYPKGPMLVPRAKLHVLDLHGKGVKYRVLGTALGFVAGAAGGLGVAIKVQGGLFGNDHQTAAPASMVAVMAGVTAAGTHWVMPEIGAPPQFGSSTNKLRRAPSEALGFGLLQVEYLHGPRVRIHARACPLTRAE